MLRADTPCQVSIDGKVVGMLAVNQPLVKDVDWGDHVVEAVSTNGLSWEQVVHVDSTAQKLVQIALSPVQQHTSIMKQLQHPLFFVAGALVLAIVGIFIWREYDRPQPGSTTTNHQTGRWTKPVETNSIGMTFVRIPAGEFRMGSNDGHGTEKPVHVVRISKPFYLGKYEVTQEEWQKVMESNPSKFQGNPRQPVEQVSWDEVQEFIRRLNDREGGNKSQLPTEAEWEYAARGTDGRAYPWGHQSPFIPDKQRRPAAFGRPSQREDRRGYTDSSRRLPS